MPNWCECELSVKGKPEFLAMFKEFATTDNNVLDQDKFVSYPEKFNQYTCEKCGHSAPYDEKDKEHFPMKCPKCKEEYMKDGYNSGGYEWCIANWGTKWGISDANVTDGKTTLEYSFQTAWTPPIPVIEAMARKFPTLEFRLKFWEGGAGFRGIRKFKFTETLVSKDYDYNGERGG